MMQTTIPLYGFGGGSGSTGAALTVTAPAGATVTVSKDGKSKTKVAGADGVAVFKGLATGTWTVTITDGEQEAQKTVAVTADYSTEITFFSATIHVTYPAGFTCTATDGTTTLTAPDTSGTWDCVVPNAGTWTVSLDRGFSEVVTLTNNGETKIVDEWHIFNGGDKCTSITGDWTGKDYQVYLDNGSSANHVDGNISDGAMNLFSNGSLISVLGTDRDIDLTGFTKLTIDWDATKPKGEHSIHAGINSSKKVYTGNGNIVMLNCGGVTGRKKSIIDISGLNSRYYIYFNTYWGAVSGGLVHSVSLS